MARLKIVDCLEKAGTSIPRELKRELVDQTRNLVAQGMDHVEAGRQVATQMRDQLRTDQQKVRDAIAESKKPKPTQVYHGASGRTSGGLGAHYTADRGLAERFGEGGKVTSRPLDLKNPIRVKDHGLSHNNAIETIQDFVKQGVLPERFQNGLEDRLLNRAEELRASGTEMTEAWNRANLEEMTGVRDYFADKGHDGIVYKNTTEGRGEDSYIFFSEAKPKPAVAPAAVPKTAPPAERIYASDVVPKLIKEGKLPPDYLGYAFWERLQGEGTTPEAIVESFNKKNELELARISQLTGWTPTWNIKPGETIAHTASRDPATGKLYVAPLHIVAEDAAAAGGLDPMKFERGFVTSEGRFVGRQEALAIAKQAQQKNVNVEKAQAGELFGENIRSSLAPEAAAVTPAPTKSILGTPPKFKGEEMVTPALAQQRAEREARDTAAQQLANQFKATFPNGPQVKIWGKQMAANFRRGQGDERGARGIESGTHEGFYDSKTDTVILIPENTRTREGETTAGSMGRVLVHEAAGHGGWARLFQGGPLQREAQAIMDAFWQHQAGQDFGEQGRQKYGYRTLEELGSWYGYDTSTPEGRAKTIEEHYARLAEDPAPPKWFDGALTAITGLLRKMGFNAWTNADTRLLLQRGRDNLGIDRARDQAHADSIRYSKSIAEARQRGLKVDHFPPEMQAMLENKTYLQMNRKQVMEEAKQYIRVNGLENTLDEVLKEREPNLFQRAIGMQLTKELNERGRHAENAKVTSHLMVTATSDGQIVSMWDEMDDFSIGGLRAYADEQRAEGYAKSPGSRAINEQLDRLKGGLAGIKGDQAAKAILGTRKGKESAQEAINRKIAQSKGTLWGRYKEGAINKLANALLGPARPRGVPALEEFTHRLTKNLREQLPQGELVGPDGKPMRDEAALLGEAVRNKDKYEEVWSEAQRHVQEKFKDNPEALQSLDEHFGEILKNPFSAKSVERTVRQVMKDLNINMRDVLMQDGKTKEQIRKELTDEIVKRAGLSQEDARGIAESVHQEFDRRLQASRDALLKQLQRTRSPLLKQPDLEKLITDNHAGKLDNEELFDHLAKRFGISAWTKELSAKIQGLQKEHQKARDQEEIHKEKARAARDARNIDEMKRQSAEAKKNADRAKVFGAEMMDVVHSTIPVDAWARARALQNIFMLMNGKTIARNIFGNVALFAVDTAADVFTMTAIDPILSLKTGEHTRRSVDIGARLRGLAQPLKDYWNGRDLARANGDSEYASFKTGLKFAKYLGQLTSRTVIEVNDANRHVFSNQYMRLAEDTVALSLGAFDRSFHQAAYEGSTMRQRGLRKAGDRYATVDDPEFWDDLTISEHDQAMIEANRAIFQDPNVLSKAILKAREFFNWLSTAPLMLIGKQPTTKFGVGSINTPYGQVPGSMVMRGLEYSPYGLFVNTLYEGMATRRGEPFRQKEFGDAISRGLLGSGGLALGVWLAYLGIMSGDGEEDDDVRAFQDYAGPGKFRINRSNINRRLISGNWHTPDSGMASDQFTDYNWAQPVAWSTSVGAGLNIFGPGGPSLSGAAWAGVMSVINLPLLKGINDLVAGGIDVTRGRKDPLEYAVQTAIKPEQWVPTFVSQINQYYSNQQRETSSRVGGPLAGAFNRALARVPGISEKYPAKYDSFGKALEWYGYGGWGFINTFLNPITTTKMRNSPAVVEMNRLYSITQEPKVVADKVDHSIEITEGGKSTKVELTNEEIAAYQKISGERTLKTVGELIASPQYVSSKTTDDQRARALVAALEDVHDKSKLQVIHQYPDIKKRLIQERQRQIQEFQANKQRILSYQGVPTAP